MKRSEINKALKELEAMCREYKCYLPPFCGFTPEQWQSIGHEYDEVRDCMLGWDITDYGLGDFEKVGFSLITLRNGNLAMADRYPKTYAEKLLFLKEGQYSPNHFHWHKMEDIINRGGGTLLRAQTEAPDGDMRGAIDAAVGYIERQILKNKTRLAKRLRSEGFPPPAPTDDFEVAEEKEFQIVRTKRFAVKPMSAEEAILQMNLLDHTFFVFRNSDDDSLSIVYQRKNGGYGLIVTDEEE